LAAGLVMAAALVATFGQAGAAPAMLPETYREVITVAVAGVTGVGDGAVATGQSDGVLRGHIRGIYVDWAAGVTTTSDITISTVNAPVTTVLYKANSATDAWFYPVVAQHLNTDGSAQSAFWRVPVDDLVQVAVGQSTTGTVSVTLLWGE
jgi:hypothetical protein